MSLGIPFDRSHKFKLEIFNFPERTSESEVVIFVTELKHIYSVRF